MHPLLRILSTFIIFVLVDSIYLYSAKDYFKTQITSVQKGPIEFRIGSAILCYIALVFGLWYFILREKKSWKDAFLLGIVIYAVYETTNYATFRGWKPLTVVMDTLWGGILFALITKIVQLLKIY